MIRKFILNEFDIKHLTRIFIKGLSILLTYLFTYLEKLIQ